MLPRCLTLQEWLRQCDNSGLGLWHVQVPGVQVGCMGQLPSSAPSPCPTACMPYLEEGHVLAIVLFALLQICAVDEGAALLGIAITCGDTTESVRQPCPAHTWRTPTPQGHRCEGSWLPTAPAGELPGLWAPCSCPVPAQTMAGRHPSHQCHLPHLTRAGAAVPRSHALPCPAVLTCGPAGAHPRSEASGVDPGGTLRRDGWQQ